MAPRTLVTGGCGYIGALAVQELQAAGRDVRVLDVLLHGQRELAARQREQGVEVVEGDLRDRAARQQALSGVDEVVHLAAIVGEAACDRDPAVSHAVNVEGTTALVDEAREAGVRRFVFASTCSNYGRMADLSVPIGEDGELAPLTLYAEQKVAMERMLLGDEDGPLARSCLRFATVYGAGPRMRFDLTVNEFTRDLWADRELEVFGEQTWRPYLHVRDAARAIRAVLEAPVETVRGEVFNVGRSSENYRKQDIVEAVREQVDSGRVSFVQRDSDRRDYRVSFDKVRNVLGFETLMTVPDGVAEVVAALEREAFGDPFDPRHRNTP
jgi:nucleoside-diphosphate-sugar epimerase